MSNALAPYPNRANFNKPYPKTIHPAQCHTYQLGCGDYDNGSHTRNITTTGNPQYPDTGQHRPTGILCPNNCLPPAQPGRACFTPSHCSTLPNPSRACLPFVDPQCPACGKFGHTTQTCNMLAMAISLRRYLRDQVSTDMMTKIEQEDWLSKHRTCLQQMDSHTPQQII